MTLAQLHDNAFCGAGIDNDKAWTLKDAKNYRGDRALLKHVKTPKEALGLCEPLARKQTRGKFDTSLAAYIYSVGKQHLCFLGGWLNRFTDLLMIWSTAR